jgi:hypothetical protein
MKVNVKLVIVVIAFAAPLASLVGRPMWGELKAARRDCMDTPTANRSAEHIKACGGEPQAFKLNGTL